MSTNLLAVIREVRASGRQRSVCCPAHPDQRPSLSVSPGEDGKIVLKCHAGCDPHGVLKAAGLKWADVFPPKPPKAEIVRTYDYRDASGALLYQVVRYNPKNFKQRRPDPAGGWLWNLRGVTKVPYKLPELEGQAKAVIVEGEKDVETLWSLGIPATCNAGGASKSQHNAKWGKAETDALYAAGCRHAIIIPDNDDPGRVHADKVAIQCRHAGMAVSVVTLPGIGPHGDVTDWLAAGHPKSELLALAGASPVWTAETAPITRTPVELPLVGLGALLAEPDDAVDWLVQDRFAFGSVNLLAGKPKGGKSTLARALALAVARGTPWLGFACQPGQVVYVALEDKRSEIRRHLRAMGATDEPVRFLIGQASRDLLGQLTALIEGGDRIDLLIIDTAQRLLAVKDTNDYSAVTAAFEPVLALARTHRTCIVLLHHAGKMERSGVDAILGSTAWAGSVDNVLLLNRTSKYRVLSSIQRIGPDLDETIVEMDDTTGHVRFAGSRSLVDIQSIAEEMVKHVLGEPAGLTRAELLSKTEGKHQFKVKALEWVLTDRRVTRTGAGIKGDSHRYHGTREPASAPTREFDSGSLVPSIGREPESSSSLDQVSPIATGLNSGSHDHTGSRPDLHDDAAEEVA